MNALTRRDFVAGSAALGLVLAARTGFDAAVRSYVDFLYQLA